MKKPKNTSWEALEKAWQKQIQAHESEVPANMWERMEKQLDEKRIQPLWLRMNTWVWSAAAVIAILIALNWESNIEPIKTSPIAKQVENDQSNLTPPSEIPVMASQTPNSVAKINQQSRLEPEQVYTPSVEPSAQPIEQQPIITESAKIPDQPEEVWVRIDINPVEETAKPGIVSQQEDMPVISKKKTLLGRLLKQVKQVVAGEQLNWQELKEGNRSLEDGIHQVANTYYRTEQTVKQTFHIQ